jgi:hypothetical protein
VREIPLDSEHLEGPLEWWMGDSRGRWEGDTLVVDVVHFNTQTWFDRAGNHHSEALHVVERYSFIDADRLRYEATIEDPKVFSRPTGRRSTSRRTSRASRTRAARRDAIGSNIRTWMGQSRGRWEGNTLVIETTHQNGRQWLDNVGNFYSDRAHIVERIAMVDENTLLWEARIEDPTVYTRPWTMTFPLRRNTTRRASS